MAWSQSDLDTLRAAIATGALKVRYADGREITYRNLADMNKIMDDIAASLVTTSPLTRVAGGYRSGLSTGLGSSGGRDGCW